MHCGAWRISLKDENENFIKIEMIWWKNLPGNTFNSSDALSCLFLWILPFRLKDDGTGTPYDKESMAIIKLNNTTVLYLKEVTKFLALVCFVREESFERKGLIDYNFHCFRKAIQEVFEVRMKVVRSRKHQSHVQKNKRPTPNGTPRMPL